MSPGSIGGMLIATLTGFLLQLTGDYLVLFIICGSMYLLAFMVFNALAPNLEQVEM